MYLVAVVPLREIPQSTAIRNRGNADGTADKNPTEDTTEKQILDEYM